MQLELDLLSKPAANPPEFVVTRPLGRHARCNDVIARVQYVRRFFPELKNVTIKVGLTRAASGMAIMGGNEIWLNPARRSYHTIAHELVHLLQTREPGIPQGEKSCDVFSMARHWTLNDVPPSYVTIPARLANNAGYVTTEGSRLIYDVATEALARRENGLRRYINFFETELKARTRLASFKISTLTLSR